ncbi:MAG: GNAT family N-acetyltransferase [Chloroflexi bacterium]|nr:GNAT family N-acetyltransferase [Chloroflexota bacterium]
MLFYPVHLPVPAGLQTAEFLLRPLRTTDVVLDFEAVMASKDLLRRWSGSGWPADDFTVADNLKDLELHENEHLQRQAFTFTVLHPGGAPCLGCVYVNSLRQLLEFANAGPAALEPISEREAVTRFWVRPACLVEGLDECLLAALISWQRQDWEFPRLLFRTNENDLRQVELLEKQGFVRRYALEVAGRRGKYVVFGP